MRLILTGTALALLLGLAYVAAPFYTAWSLREAIRTADSAYLERKIEWDSVRASLKTSLARHANLVPEINDETAPIKPGLWQRVKMAFGQSMIDNFVERSVTPTGLPKMFEAKKAFNEKVRGEVPPEATLTRIERFKQFWARLQRAEFQSFTRIEIEVKDRRAPDRHYVSLLELKGFEWKLTELRVKAAPKTASNFDAALPFAGVDGSMDRRMPATLR